MSLFAPYLIMQDVEPPSTRRSKMTPAQNLPRSTPESRRSKLPFAFKPRTKAALSWMKLSKTVARWIAPWLAEMNDDPS